MKSHAVDFDGTLATYNGYKGSTVLGEPIKSMVDLVKKFLADGDKVTIFTARADQPESIEAIKEWTIKHIGQELNVTNIKLPEFSDFYDDKAIKVVKNQGTILSNNRKQSIEESIIEYMQLL